MPVKLALYEDNIDLRESLSALFMQVTDFELMGAFCNCDHVLEEMEQLKPEIVLMDIDMPGTNGIEGLKKIKASCPGILVMMLTVFEDNKHIFDAVCNGASGYILKTASPEQIIAAVVELSKGGAPMTPPIARKVLEFFSKPVSGPDYNLSKREMDVLVLLVKGCSYKMIAHELYISIDTVRSHIKKIYEKLQVNTMTEAVAKAIHNKIV